VAVAGAVTLSVPFAEASALTGMVMPTVSRPTTPMTPTENDAVAMRRTFLRVRGAAAAAGRPSTTGSDAVATGAGR